LPGGPAKKVEKRKKKKDIYRREKQKVEISSKNQ